MQLLTCFSTSTEKVDIYSGQDAIIHCPVSRGEAEDYTITLRFEESSTILKTRVTNITEHWAGTQVHLRHDRNVTLYKLDMDKHTGNYTCETLTELSITEVVQTSLQIISGDSLISSQIVHIFLLNYRIKCLFSPHRCPL